MSSLKTHKGDKISALGAQGVKGGVKGGIEGKSYWRSFDQLENTPEFQKALHREFPEGASELNDPVSRRTFLTLMGASVALAGLASCRRPVEKIVPYVIAPEDLTPGVPQYYATSMPQGMNASGLLVESHEGRPTKIEGNKRHPSTLGSSNSLMQAEILSLYDPDRSTSVFEGDTEKSWADFVTDWSFKRSTMLKKEGRGLAVISQSFNSPTMSTQAKRFKERYPQATWVAYEPISDENIYAGLKLASGKSVAPVYNYSRAKVILSLGSDFLYAESENITASRGFADGRRMRDENDSMNRLYVVESSFTLTGGMADHRLRLQNSQIGPFTAALARALAAQGVAIAALEVLPIGLSDGFDKKWLEALAKDLISSRGSSLVVAGRSQTPTTHALVAAINSALGNIDNTVSYHKLDTVGAPNSAALGSLVKSMAAGKISTLIIMGGNPVYDAPSDLDFAAALKNVGYVVHLGQSKDETSQKAQWHLPLSHFLESWGDVRSIDGSLSVVQPLISPLYDTRSAQEVISLLVNGSETSGYDLTRETWKETLPTGRFEASWRRVLHDGLLENSASKPLSLTLDKRSLMGAFTALSKAPRFSKSSMELSFVAGGVFDGRYANNGWLQELPDPVSKITWDNVAMLSPTTAAELGVETGQVVELSLAGRKLEAPAYIAPGHADYAVTLALGYGRELAGRVGSGVGVNAYLLRSSESADFASGLSLVNTGRQVELANTQDHNSMEGRPLVREATLEEYRAHPEFAPEMVETPDVASLWTEHRYDEGYQWGMSIDLNACTGCNACSIACQSENNISVIGKEQVAKGREMSWLRLDRYFAGDPSDPQMVTQPMACQHCEMAPCEQVCPVAATVHDKEGLNVMVYNRCIGTRYCSNNCPFKVRRFNFFNYTNDTPEVVKMAMNPDVTVRSRGVMEKCTYCTQRIQRAKTGAKSEGRQVEDGEVVSACQQACPTQAIVFGNINDPESEVSRMKQKNRKYDALTELYLRPRTSYLARLRNPNPELPHQVTTG